MVNKPTTPTCHCPSLGGLVGGAWSARGPGTLRPGDPARGLAGPRRGVDRSESLRRAPGVGKSGAASLGRHV